MTRVSTLVTMLFLLAACSAAPGPAPEPDDPDARRMAVMRDEPLIARDPGPTIPATDATHRLRISATLLDEEAQNAGEVARKQTSDAMIALRENRWVVYFAACQPPSWEYKAYAYKIVDGVSYNAVLDGSAGSNRAKLVLRLRAPRSSEPGADVFRDRPPALESGKSCIEASTPPEAQAETGTATVMAENFPPGFGDR